MRYLVTFKAGENCRMSDTQTITTVIREDVFDWWSRRGWKEHHPKAAWCVLLMVFKEEDRNRMGE